MTIHISDEAVKEILTWGGGPEPALVIDEESWKRFFRDWNKQLLNRPLTGKKSGKTYKCKYCGGTAYWMETSKGFRMVDFFDRPHQCENYLHGKAP